MTDIDRLLESLYHKVPVVGQTGKHFDSLPALSTASNLKYIHELCRLHPSASTLEIGLAFGGSAVVFASVHRQNDTSLQGSHIAIDPFQSTVWDNVGRLKLVEAGLSKYVSVLEETSSMSLPRLLAEHRRFGIIYVDGSHLFEDVFIDAYFGVRLLDIGGYILFDDSTDPHVAAVLSFIKSNVPGLELQPETSLKHTVARALGKRQLTVYRRTAEVERAWNAPFSNF